MVWFTSRHRQGHVGLMDTDKIAEIIRDNMNIVGDQLVAEPSFIDALADYFEKDRWELLERLKNEHSMEAAVAIGPFNRADFIAKATGGA